MPTQRIVTGQRIRPEVAARAEQLRREMTPAEKQLWARLRANRLGGWHFRRQQVISGFIVDFYCHRAGLVVEVDGPIHQGQAAADAERDAILRAHDLRILRFTNDAVLKQSNAVLDAILAEVNVLAGDDLPPNPLPKGRGSGKGE
ncbi:MAG: DUF559 domain-containing protein [Anaerolineales bacterium]|nr:DUF559 domain-containing protein [Anaerolineales bacterium]